VGVFVRGDIVVVPFPFSDLSASKRRPALVLAAAGGDDLILSQITSKHSFDNMAVAIGLSDVLGGTLNSASNIRPNKIFTADKGIVVYKLGTLNAEKIRIVLEKIAELFGF
jgi:mRNA interferase MazF